MARARRTARRPSATEPAEPVRYTDTGPIHDDAPAAVRFWGNFHALSCVFQIDTDEPDIIARLTEAIRANQASPAYQEARRALLALRESAD